MGTCCAGEHAGTVRCRWACLPRVDPLCDRMERGEEEAVRAAAMHFSAAISADVKARSFRRAAAENCRPAIFEARATLREQSGSTLGRRVYAPEVCPRLLGIEECPHYRQSFWLASLAPSAMAPSFRYTMSGTTAPNPANVLNPQSDPAMTRSRPTMSANFSRRSATSSGCST